MTKEELAISINNAINRGVPFEEAIDSFLNAGYNEQDVKGAADILKSGTINLIYESSEPDQIVQTQRQNKDKQTKKNPQESALSTAQPGRVAASQATETSKKHGKYFIPLIIAILSLFIIGLIVALIFLLM